MSQKANLLLDAGIMAALLVALQPSLTGIPVHEWFSLSFAGAIIVHLLFHWKWITHLTLNFFKNLFHLSRAQYLIDGLLFIAFTATIFSGLMISRSVLPFFNILSIRNPIWRELHSFSAYATLIIAAVHFATHWNWIVGMVKRLFVSPVHSPIGRPAGSSNLPASCMHN